LERGGKRSATPLWIDMVFEQFLNDDRNAKRRRRFVLPAHSKNEHSTKGDTNMNTRNIFTKVSIAIALVALVATGAVWQIRRAHAMPTAVEDQARFGMIGLTRGQTMRLNIVNLSQPPDPDKQIPPPCRVVLSFRDAAGQPIRNSDGQVIRREVSLQSGESAFLDLNADMFGGPSTNADVAPARLQLRPFVRVLQAPGDPNIPPPCFPTMEVFDNTSGRTSIISAGFVPPPEPGRQQ